MSEKNDEIVKQTVDIVISSTEYIKNRDHFDHNITFQVVPVRIARTEHTSISILVIRSKNIDKVPDWVCL